jgi:hypothetical protein
MVHPSPVGSLGVPDLLQFFPKRGTPEAGGGVFRSGADLAGTVDVNNG